jgi:hypothetical protein
MIRGIENVTRGNRVSSEEIREIIDGLYQKYASNYHKTLQLFSLLRTASLGLEMTNSAWSAVTNALVETGDNILDFTPYSSYLYPTSIADGEKAEIHQEFMAFIGKRVNSRLVFTDTDNVIDPSITIIKSVHTSDNSIPTRVIENIIDNCITGEAPFIARYLMDSAVKTTLNVTIRSTAKPLSINSLRFIPIPAVGMVTLDNLTYGAGTNVVLNGGAVLPAITSFDMSRSYQGYINFRPLTTTILGMSLSSETYISSFEAVAIGLSRLIGELNTYASTSYIGWLAEYPTGYTKISNIQILPARYSNGVANTRVKIYDNLNDFNLANDSYIELCDDNTNLNIQATAVPTPYILLEIDNDNGTTPCVERVRLQFGA